MHGVSREYQTFLLGDKREFNGIIRGGSPGKKDRHKNRTYETSKRLISRGRRWRNKQGTNDDNILMERSGSQMEKEDNEKELSNRAPNGGCGSTPFCVIRKKTNKRPRKIY